MAMTINNSKYNRYDIDQRLTVDTRSVFYGPLQHVRNTPVGNDERPISSSNDTKSLASLPASASQRSIFSAYWSTTPTPPTKPSSITPPRSNTVANEQVRQGKHQLHQQRRRIQKHNTYSYNDLQDPYAYFGIEEEQHDCGSTSDTDDSSTNSYENFLRRQEVAATSNAVRERSNASYHCFSSIDLQSMGSLLASNKKTTQSDTILFAKTSFLKRSCLRKGRFSSCRKDVKREDQVRSSKGTIPRTQSVSFEPAVEVRMFETPVERWAPSGWSNWFTA